jgi:hypothetical protein
MSRDIAIGLPNLFDSEVGKNTTTARRTSGSKTITGTTWLAAINSGVLAVTEEIGTMLCTRAGSWAGVAEIKITDLDGTLIYPDSTDDVCTEAGSDRVDFTDAVEFNLINSLKFSPGKGYIIYVRSTSAADGAGETVTIIVRTVQE